MENFVICLEYGYKLEIELKNMYGESMGEQIIIGKFIDKRHRKEKAYSSNKRMARPLISAPLLEGFVELNGINDDDLFWGKILTNICCF